MNIVLIGYMASGKSAVGKVLANKLNISFIDLDDYIESNENQNIASIFEEKGEVYFRKIETLYLKQLLNNQDNIVVSLGGGTPCYGVNMEIILDNSESIYLKASINTIYNRLKKEKTKRPLVADIADDKLEEFIAKHLFERRFYYEQANRIVTTDNQSIKEVVGAVLKD